MSRMQIRYSINGIYLYYNSNSTVTILQTANKNTQFLLYPHKTLAHKSTAFGSALGIPLFLLGSAFITVMNIYYTQRLAASFMS